MKNITMDQIVSFEDCKDAVLPALKPDAADAGKDLVFPFLDLKMWFYLPMANGLAHVSKELVKLWGVTPEQVKEAAIKNAATVAEVRPLEDVMAEIYADMVDEDADLPIEHSGVMVITNQTKFYGAGCIASYDILDRTCDLIDSNSIMILPSSVHEMMCVPAGQLSIEEASELVASVNGEIVPEKEQLGDTVYFYNKALRMLSYELPVE